MTPEQSEELDAWRNGFALRMDALEAKLHTNTEATTRIEKNTGELVDILESFKGAMNVLELFGKLAKPLAYIAGLITACATAWWALWPKK